eukprot:gene41233-50320_t
MTSIENPMVDAEDKFRRVDRGIKAFLKGCLENRARNHKKRPWIESPREQKASDELFSVGDIVNVSSPLSSSRLRFVRSSSGCLCSEAHQCNAEMKIYELLGYPSGLYIISQGLCKEAQYIWAKRALEKYSKEEHTNLSNLHPGEDHSNIWEESKHSKDDFQSFKKLRW